MGKLILSKARELFCSYGMKSISMDELAKSAGLSKKTIYQHYPDKSELVNALVTDLISEYTQKLELSKKASSNAIEEVIRDAEVPFMTWSGINPSFFSELQKFFPVSWDKLQAYRQTLLLPRVINNLKNGIDAGLYRTDLNLPFTAAIRIDQCSSSLQSAAWNKSARNPMQVLLELTMFYLHSITSTRGRKILEKYILEKQKNISNYSYETI